MKIEYPAPEQFMAALGKAHDSQEVMLIFEAFGIVWGDVKQHDRDFKTRLYQSDELGIGFTFEHEGDVYEKPYYESDNGLFVLTQCTFWGFNDETKYYAGPIFKNLKFTEPLEQAVKKLGPAIQFHEGPTEPYRWKITDQVRLSIDWPEPNKARVVTYWINTFLLQIEYPTPEQFMAALGKSHDSPEVTLIFDTICITWNDIKKYDKDSETRMYQSNERGIGFAFENEGDVYKKPYHGSGDGLFIMTQCTFWGFNNETNPYTGSLFKNLKFTESLKEAEIKLGRSSQFRDGAMRPYRWKITDQVCLSIDWPKPNKARVVTYWLITPGM